MPSSHADRERFPLPSALAGLARRKAKARTAAAKLSSWLWLAALLAGCMAVPGPRPQPPVPEANSVPVNTGTPLPQVAATPSPSMAPTPTTTPLPTTVALPPAGKVAYVYQGDIWTKELPDGEARRLTHGGRANSPAWSHSGEWLTFDQDNKLWVMRGSGADARPIDVAVPGHFSQTAWSPTGDALAWDSPTSGLLVIDPAQGDQRVLVPSSTEGAGFIGAIAWSPDGQWLAFHRQMCKADGSVTSQGLWRVRADGSEVMPVFLNPDPVAAQSYLAGWSPDGQALLFWEGHYSSAMLGGGVRLLRLPVAGGAPFEVSRGALVRPDLLAWSPVGSRLAMVEGTSWETWEGKAIAVAGDQGARPLVTQGWVDLFPAWSPDGRTLAFCSLPEQPHQVADMDAKPVLAQRHIWLMAADGSGRRALTGGTRYRDERPRWSADGKTILFARLIGEQTQLWLMAPDGSGLRPVVDELSPGPGWFGYHGFIEWAEWYDWWTT